MTRFLFLDTEFTGEHQYTTLVSLALVGIHGEELHVTLNDYDREQVTAWLRENVLAHIDETQSVSRRTAFERVSEFVEHYGGGKRVSLVSAGKLTDIILMFQLWHEAYPERRWFHNLYCLPDSLNHAAHFDLNTMLFLAGIDPGVDRSEYGELTSTVRRHDALSDARVVRACFEKLIASGSFPNLRA